MLKRLKTIFMSNNRVSKIADSLHTAIPNLETLVLINNRISRLEELEALRSCKNLRSLALLDNPVTKIATYRLYVIHCIPSLRLLDFRRVRIKVRFGAGVRGCGAMQFSTNAGASVVFAMNLCCS